MIAARATDRAVAVRPAASALLLLRVADLELAHLSVLRIGQLAVVSFDRLLDRAAALVILIVELLVLL